MPWYAWLALAWICGGALFLAGWVAGASVVRASVAQESVQPLTGRGGERGELRLEDAA
jgi:hypothetical protein